MTAEEVIKNTFIRLHTFVCAFRDGYTELGSFRFCVGNNSNLPQPLGLGLTLGIGLGIGLGAEMDQGYVTQFDSHSNSSSEVVVSAGSTPLLLAQSSGTTTTDSPPVAPRTRVPLYAHGTQGIAPTRFPKSTPTYLSMNLSSFLHETNI